MSLGYPSTAYVWFDTEYSTLELDKAVLLQVAMIVTDANLERLAPKEEDINLFVKLPRGKKVSPWIMENMPDLVEKCRSPEAVSVDEVERRLCEAVERAVVVPAGEDKRKPVLAGNSIHCDWFLARKFLPGFLSRLHYRHLDVTAIKLQWQDWFKGEEFDKSHGELTAKFFAGSDTQVSGRQHDAYYDVQASIAELNYYRKCLMKV